jgi:hypothetical protein
MLDRLNEFDWEEAFKYAEKPERIEGDVTVSTAPFDREGVKEIIAIVDGENDESDWLGVFELHDGRFAVLGANCDYTGWG